MTRPPSQTRLKSLIVVGISALVGIVALVVALLALLLGLWIDGQLGQRGPATICLLVLSVPINLLLMIYIAFGLIKRFNKAEAE